MGTQLVAVRSALVAALAELPEYLAAGPTGQTPEVSFGWRMNWTAREKVWTQRARFTHEPAGMRGGTTFRNETGEFDLMIAVNGVGVSIEDAFTRAVELFVAADDWVSYKPNWNNPVLVPGIYELQIVGDGEIPDAIGGDGAGLAEARIPILYRARIE